MHTSGAIIIVFLGRIKPPRSTWLTDPLSLPCSAPATSHDPDPQKKTCLQTSAAPPDTWLGIQNPCFPPESGATDSLPQRVQPFQNSHTDRSLIFGGVTDFKFPSIHNFQSMPIQDSSQHSACHHSFQQSAASISVPTSNFSSSDGSQGLQPPIRLVVLLFLVFSLQLTTRFWHRVPRPQRSSFYHVSFSVVQPFRRRRLKQFLQHTFFAAFIRRCVLLSAHTKLTMYNSIIFTHEFYLHHVHTISVPNFR